MKIHEEIARNVQAELKRKGEMAPALVPVLGKSLQAVYKKLNGTIPLTTNELGKISTFLSIPFTTLLDGVGQTKEAS